MKPSSPGRILDANFNRSREALRVIEEYVRFNCNNKTLTTRLKRFRHQLAQATAQKAFQNCIKSRNTPADVGCSIQTKTESLRKDAFDVVCISFKRLQEALRVMEEYGKVISSKFGATCENLRYEAYAIESELKGFPLIAQLENSQLYGLITKKLCRYSPSETAKALIDGGIDIIQLREKEMPDKEFLKQAEEIRKIVDGSGVILLINDRIPIAQIIDAHGVHLGQDDLPIKEARAILGSQKIIGLSTHGISQARAAAKVGADYIGIGPVYPTNTKEHRRSIGTETVERVAKEVSLPHFAIGSVNRKSIDTVLASGVKRLAICTALTLANDVAKETAFFKRRLKKANSK